MTNYYFAPLEGIGGYLFRNTHAIHFGGADKYFSPFVSPNENRSLTKKALKDILPEHNEPVHLIPQILTNNSTQFINAAKELASYGYEEINLNLGCPSRTVVSKKRGSGFLALPDKLDDFLYDIYDKLDLKLSLKTRLGVTGSEDFLELMEIYNKYPVHELIIHPRIQKDFYKNHPQMDVFDKALAMAKMPVVYNGDLFNKEKTLGFCQKYSSSIEEGKITGLMMGRGVLSDPNLFLELKNKDALTKEKFQDFHDDLVATYQSKLVDDTTVLYKMKEHWIYMIHIFSNHQDYEKKIKKSQRLSEYRSAVKNLIREQELVSSTFDGY